MKKDLNKLIKEVNENFSKEKIEKIYKVLLEKTQKLQEKLPEGGYPENSISGDIWILGAEIYDYCYDIFETVKNYSDLKTQEKFLQIWTEATFGVVSHYRSNVGVIMTENMYFFERKLEFEKIPLFAKGVFDDFEFLLDYIDEDFNENDFETIQGINYLIIACKKMLEYGDENGKNEANRILEKIKKLPKNFQKLLDYDFHYKKGFKILNN